ncbi:MAG: exopolysaccharide biosynthesis polyprenyl glycosylphosphotransferase [Prochlorococcus marinus XMU1428]|nr:exopolysaccharide biosynthesis polyprenyl glycosylphosphotransferase [Prochlorococcus marinus XMU1428]
MASRTLIKTRQYILVYIFFELSLISISIFLASITSDVDYRTQFYTIVILFLWPIFSYLGNRYENIFVKEKFIHFIFKLLLSSAIIIFAYSFLATTLDLFKILKSEYQVSFSYIFLFKTLIFNLFFNLFFQPIFNKFFKVKRKIEVWNFIGSDNTFLMIKKSLSDKKYKNFLKVKKISKSFVNNLEDKKIIIDHQNNIENFYYSLLDENIENISDVLNIEDWYEKVFEKIPINLFTLENIYQLKLASKNNFSNKIKRIGDIVFSVLILLLTFPISLISALLISLEDQGPIFYKQKRVGLNGKIFNIYKFRSMDVKAESEGIKWATKNDPRTTKIGRLLRNTRFDEIPQLLTVLRGEMSLIGPRPERPEIEKMLKKNIDHYNLKYLAKPGLSGWAQVNYPYGSSLNDSRNKLAYDIFYIKNKSIFLDLIIFIKTIRVVINFKRYGSN